MSASQESAATINVGVSACLLGHRVRYDGGHKRDRYLLGSLGRYFNWVPVCPEVELGLETPRPSLRLEECDGHVRLMMSRHGIDLSERMNDFCHARVDALGKSDLCGFVLKKNSPSCGMERVRVYRAKGPPRRDGRGLFADALIGRFANLPVEEEGRLHDPVLCENWVTRVFACHRLRQLWKSSWTIGDLLRFQTDHKYLLLAHSPATCKELGRLAAGSKLHERRQLENDYERLFMAALSRPATQSKNTNVLQRMAGFFKNRLDAAGRNELCEVILDYRAGIIPLAVPLALIEHYSKTFDVEYIKRQVYINPYPKQLALRNHVSISDNLIVQEYGVGAGGRLSQEMLLYRENYPG